jgi:aminoglycoside 2''-phosphotransferase
MHLRDGMVNVAHVPAEYEARIRAARPDLVIREMALNQEGLVNDVVIINDALVFRFGKREWAAEDLAQEGKCLALMKKYVDVRLPEWTVHAPDFISYEKIPGEPLQRHDILRWPEADQKGIAAELGQFLSVLHGIPLEETEAHGIGPSATKRRPEDWLKLYEDVREKLYPLLMETSKAWAEQHFAPLLADPGFMDCEERLMNGDLSPYHLLVDPETRRLSGIIDFGTVGLGDPACDFACLIDAYGESFVRRVARYYEDDIEELIERARFWAGTVELQWLLGGLREPQDPSWFAVHIGRARDVRPVGSGW